MTKISHKIIFITGASFLISSIIMIMMMNDNMKKHALEDAESKAEMILETNLAVHTFYEKQLKQDLFETIKPENDSTYFDPIWMSSTYAVREINKYRKFLKSESYYYKECAINARSPENEADDYERSFLKLINEDPNVMEKSKIRTIGGIKYLDVLRRGEKMEKECLRCHSTPDKAPKGLVEKYGDKRSFNRHLNEYVSAISIRVPIEKAYEDTRHATLRMTIYIALLLSVIYLVILWLNRIYLLNPLKQISLIADLIATNPKHLGEEINLNKGKELNELITSFNKMSKNLKKYSTGLERIVEARTKELKETNDKLVNKNNELEEVNESKNKIISIISHDLRSPFQGILGYTQMLINDADKLGKDDIKLIAERLNDSITNEYNLLEQLLAWTKLEQGKMIIQKEKVNLFEVTSEAVNVLKLVAEKKEIIIENNIDKDLQIISDEIMLKTIVRNIVSNSLKFTDSKGKIIINALENKETINIKIEDNGIGMEQDEISKVFSSDENYTQKGTKMEDGNGIGISIVKGMVNLLKGKIVVSSKKSVGTKIDIILPIT